MMAETSHFIMMVLLVTVTAGHLFGVGTLVYAEDVSCRQRCNLRQGYCTPDEKCRCFPGWEGENCNECTKAPGCDNGYCDQPWQCLCHEGWGGPRCDRDLKVCERTRPCQNHATCINNDDGSYLCVCQIGFSGPNCETYSPGGVSDPVTTTKPTTPASTTLDEKKCLNGGWCKSGDAKNGCSRCQCQPGYVGKYCETNVNECLMMPCANGGKCFDLSNDFYCECARGFTGRYCNDEIDECSLNPNLCFNGGTCVNTFGSYECVCPSGYSGKRCGDKKRPRYTAEIPKRVMIPALAKVLTTRSSTTTDNPESTTRTTPTTSTTRVTEITVTKSASPRKPQLVPVVKKSEVKMTRITHEVKITSMDSEYSAANNELIIRQEQPMNSDAVDSSAQAMQIMTFVFMGLAIVILAAILVLVWMRCYSTHSGAKNNRDELCDTPRAVSVISSVEREIQSNRQSMYDPVPLNEPAEMQKSLVYQSMIPTTTAQDDQSHRVQIDNSEQEYMQRERHLASSRTASSNIVTSCPSPPPPYQIKPEDISHSRNNLRPVSGYYVALPPTSSSARPLSSHHPSARDQCYRNSVGATYASFSEDPEEMRSLLFTDNSIASNRIVV